MLTISDNSEKGDTGRKYFKAANPWDYIPTGQRYMDTDSTTVSAKFDYKASNNIAFDLLIAGMDYQWGFETYDSKVEDRQILTNRRTKPYYRRQDALWVKQ